MLMTEAFMLGVVSLPPREAWIEIAKDMTVAPGMLTSLPPREAWIEISIPQKY